MRDRVVGFKRIPARQILPNPKNWRRHPREQVSAFRALLSEVGFVGAVIVREVEDGYELIDGHLRVGLLQDETVPALVVDLTDEETDIVLSTYDPLGAMAKVNREKLDALTESLRDEVRKKLENIKEVKLPTPRDVDISEPPKLRRTVVCPECGAEFEL